MAPVQVQQLASEVTDFMGSGDSAAVMDEQESLLSRTESQALRQRKVQLISEKLSQRRQPVQELMAITNTCANGYQKETRPLGECLEDIERQQRTARNLGEDLMEDMLALDSLANLFAEDRVARKAALADLEELTDAVDGIKSALLKRRRVVEQALASAEKQGQTVHGHAGDQWGQASRVDKGDETKDCSSTEDDLEESHSAPAPAAHPQSRKPALPSANEWAKLKLPLKLNSHAMSDGWVVDANLLGLRSDDIELQLDARDKSLLLISGLKVPTHQELAALDVAVRRQLRGRPPSLNDYLQVGKHRFGAIDECIRLPHGIDLSAIQANCQNGKLRLILPRRRQLRQRDTGAMTSRNPLAAFRSAGADYSPQFPGW